MDNDTLKDECRQLVNYYLEKTESIIKLYDKTKQARLFLLQLKGIKFLVESSPLFTTSEFNERLSTLINWSLSNQDNSKLIELVKELEEEISLLRLRFNFNSQNETFGRIT